jgi:subtilisin family serine protease
MRRLALVAAAAALLTPGLAPAGATFLPSDPLTPRQWYLPAVRAFDFWPERPTLGPVLVAVIDSGIDLSHPEFQGRVAAAQSFVGGDVTDREGHGTFVAGLIAAAHENGQGIAGVAFPAQLLVAKVVRSDGTISPEAEAKAIRWAADNGARVINLSLGGLRDERRRDRDTYSRLEQDAIEYAYGKGAVIVAAVGNGDQAPETPWTFASYPAALPHVIGVSAFAQDGSVPAFSNRDAVYNDIVAPGVGVLSTLPRAITQTRSACIEQGYSPCGPPEFKNGEGTSYAAALVSAAAALLVSVRPDLAPDQVSTLLERSAVDANASNGCKKCPLSRDPLSGWGRLDVLTALRALEGPLPPADRFESNDDAGRRSFTLWGERNTITATIDFWDDQIDVYRIRLRRNQYLSVALQGPLRTDTNLVLWKPRTQRVQTGLSVELLRQRATQSARVGPKEYFLHRAREDGWYYVEVKIASAGSGPYTLRYVKSKTPRT